MVVISFWAGFIAKSHHAQYKSKAGFVIFIALLIYFTFYLYKEQKAIDALYSVIEPLPKITEITFIPSVPSKNSKKIRYWTVETPYSVNEVVDFYTEHHSNWTLKNKTIPWMTFSNDNKELTLYITAAQTETGSKVLYTFSKNND